LWESRFHSGLVASDDYAIACYRYIDLNPMRACMVEHPSRYPWSSYTTNVGGAPQSFLTPHPSFSALASEPPLRAAAYRDLCDTPLSQTVIDEIRRATRTGQRIGGPRKRRGRPKRSTAQEIGDCHQLEMVTVTN
jgi:putative transposase